MEMIKELHIIDADSKGNIFTSEEHQYIIPLYQREYAWGEKQIARLIDDICDAEGRKYYIGTLIVAERNDGKLEVIDGQQRLTTLFLLLNCLGKETKVHLTFECRYRSNNTLENITKLRDGKDGWDDKNKEDNIVDGIEIIKRILKEKGDNVKSSLTTKLQSVILFQIVVPKHTDLNRYFEIMNTRGEQLAQHDILKAHLMKHLEPNERARFARIWDACSDMDGYVQMNFSKKQREKLFGEDWNKMPDEGKCWTKPEFPSAQQNDHTQEITNKDWTIEGILQQQKMQVPTEDESKENRKRFESIIDFPHFLLHTLKVYLYKNNIEPNNIIGKQLDDKKLTNNFVAVENDLNKEKGDFAREFIVCLLQTRFTFDQYIIKREYTSKNEDEDGEWSLNTLKRSNKTTSYNNSTFIADNEWNSTNDRRCKENLMIQSALRVSYTSPKDMHWITELLKYLYVDKHSSIFTDKYPKSITKGTGDEILTFTEGIAANAVNNFIETKKDDDKWKKCGTGTPHILLNYLDYLLWKKPPKDQKFNDFTFEFRNSVEHWFPQNPSSGTIKPWDDASWEETEEQKSTVDRLGNLCLVQRNVNSRFNNNSPSSKKTMWKDSTISKGSLKLRLMSEETTDDREWRESKCKEHEGKMVAILKDAIKNNPNVTKR